MQQGRRGGSPTVREGVRSMSRPPSRSGYRHSVCAIYSKTIKAGSTNAYPFSVAAATVDADHRYQRRRTAIRRDTLLSHHGPLRCILSNMNHKQGYRPLRLVQRPVRALPHLHHFHRRTRCRAILYCGEPRGIVGKANLAFLYHQQCNIPTPRTRSLANML